MSELDELRAQHEALAHAQGQIHMEAIMGRISAEVTAEAIRRKQQQMPPGCRVMLDSVPPALLHGLPAEDQAAIRGMVGKLITVVGYRDHQAELRFADATGAEHSIWVDVSYVHQAGR